jgi:hypothetical protein
MKLEESVPAASGASSTYDEEFGVPLSGWYFVIGAMVPVLSGLATGVVTAEVAFPIMMTVFALGG